MKKLKCLSQLPDMKGFGEVLGLCNSNGLVLLPDSLICIATPQIYLLLLVLLAKAAGCCLQTHEPVFPDYYLYIIFSPF